MEMTLSKSPETPCQTLISCISQKCLGCDRNLIQCLKQNKKCTGPKNKADQGLWLQVLLELGAQVVTSELGDAPSVWGLPSACVDLSQADSTCVPGQLVHTHLTSSATPGNCTESGSLGKRPTGPSSGHMLWAGLSACSDSRNSRDTHISSHRHEDTA